MNTNLNNQPLVSVVISSYNHALYITEAIESVVNQTYPNIQLIVIDDGSKDNSPEVIQKLADQHGFYFETQKNMGLCKTLNKALKNHVKGKYVCFLGSDDKWELNKIEKQVAYMEEHPQCFICYTNTYNIINDDIFKVPPSTQTENILDGLLTGSFTMQTVSIMLKTQIFENIGYFDSSLQLEDLDMWLRIIDATKKLGYISDYTSYHRLHKNNTQKNDALMYENIMKTLSKWHHMPCYNKAIKNRQEEFLIHQCAIYNKPVALRYISLLKTMSFKNKRRFFTRLLTKWPHINCKGPDDCGFEKIN